MEIGRPKDMVPGATFHCLENHTAEIGTEITAEDGYRLRVVDRRTHNDRGQVFGWTYLATYEVLP